MNDEHARFQDFDSSEAVLKYIKERSDDIEKAVIPLNPTITLAGKDGTIGAFEAGLILHLSDGHKKILHPIAAELVLNDGILNRMRIHIEFFRGNEQ